MAGLHDHQTWTLVDPSEVKQKVVDCKWVFKLNPETRASAAQYKATIVSKGFHQKKGMDSDETFALVAKLSTIHFLLAHALLNGMHL